MNPWKPLEISKLTIRNHFCMAPAAALTSLPYKICHKIDAVIIGCAALTEKI